MRLSTRARYALRMMIDLAKEGAETAPVSLTSVARHTGISRAYLEQLALPLRAAHLIRGVAGRSGGYRLVAATDATTLREVVEATIGPLSIVDCVTQPDVCPRSGACGCRVVYTLINRRITGLLEEYTLADLLDPSWIRRHSDELPTGLPTIEGPATRRAKRCTPEAHANTPGSPATCGPED